MEINFTISKEELVNFHMNHVTETKNYKNAIIGNTFFMILFIIFVFLISKRFSDSINVFILWVILLLFRKKYFLYGIRRKLKKVFSFEKNKNYFESTKLISNERGLKLITSLSEKIYNWESIKKVNLIDNYIFIMTSTHDDILIPIKSFESLEQKDLFLNNIVENTNLKLYYKYPIDIKYQ
jgi:hypothetical protein